MRLHLIVCCAFLAACGSTNPGHGADGGAGDDDDDDGGVVVTDGGGGGDDGGGGGDAGTGDAGGGDAGGGDAGTGTCGTCNAPANVCVDGAHVRHYSAGCTGSTCSTSSVIIDCPDGCAAGACLADPCAGVVCTDPSPTCSGSTLRTMSSTCVGGSCVVSESDETCASGCTAGACNATTCGTTTCSSPAPTTCLDAKVLSGPAELSGCNGSTCTTATLQTLCSQGCFAGECDAGSTESIFMPSPPGGSWLGATAFAVDSAGRPNIVGLDSNHNVSWMHLDAAGWHTVTIDTNLGNGVQVSLALDATGTPLVAYYEPTNKRLRYAELRGATFHLEEVSTTSPAGVNPSIAVDASGVRWIASNDGTLGMRVAHGHAGSWTFESVGTYSGATQLAFSPTGVLHLVWGDRVSHAVSSGGYYQPPAYHASRVGGAWHIDAAIPQAIVFKHSLEFAPNGDALFGYGVVSAVGQNDELRLHRYGALPSDALVESIGNWLSVSSVGFYGGATQLQFMQTTGAALAQHAGDLWTTAPHDFAQYISILDVANGPDGTPRFLASLTSNSPSNVSGWAVVTPTACAPSCTGAECGDDGCGGTCGTCGANETCGPDNQCSAWHEDTVDLPALMSYPSMQVAFALAPSGSHHVLIQYQFPEKYYTSGSTQNELFYLTDATSAWPTTAHVVSGIPTMNYAQTSIASTSMQVGPTGVPEAIYGYKVGGGKWNTLHSTGSSSAWTVDDSISGGDATPRLIATARNASGVEYTFIECGFSGGYVCVTRRDGLTADTSSTLTADSALGASAAVDSMGHAHILWAHKKATGVTLDYSTDASGSWVTVSIPGETLSASTYSDLFHTQLAIGPDGSIHIAFFHMTGGALYHGEWTGSAFAVDTVPATGATAFALAVDHAGTPVVLAVNGDATLWTQSGVGWTSDAIPTAGNASTAWLGLDAADRPHVFFQDSSAISHQLRLAVKP
ncbi:MAG TPA: hypothetical protein VGM90_21300 [Kofleriaceae bacterium]